MCRRQQSLPIVHAGIIDARSHVFVLSEAGTHGAFFYVIVGCKKRLSSTWHHAKSTIMVLVSHSLATWVTAELTTRSYSIVELLVIVKHKSTCRSPTEASVYLFQFATIVGLRWRYRPRCESV